MTTQSNVQGVWFWDTFPKYMTVLWWVGMIGAVIATALYRDGIFTWWTEHLIFAISSIIVLMALVVTGNYVPGIPNMPLPLFLGWAMAAGLSPILGIVLCLFVWSVAFNGSYGIYYKASKDLGLVRRWRLDQSERYKAARTAVRTVPNVILKSRVGKFAAYCGHINIAAGAEGYSIQFFFMPALWGHLLWTIQYIALGFLMGWLLPYVGQLFR